MKAQRDPFLIPEQLPGMKDSFLPNFSYSKEVGESLPTSESSSLWLGKIISIAKLKVFFIVILILFSILFIRLGYLQIIKGAHYHRLAEGNRLHLEYLLASRGIIFDHWHKPLVENVATFSLYLNPEALLQDEEERQKIREILLTTDNLTVTTTLDQLINNQSSLPILVKENLSYEQALALMIKTGGLEALAIVVDPLRHYLYDNINAHLLGYTSRITTKDKDEYLKKGYQLIERIGRTGIEGYYEEQLRGRPGKRQVEVDSLGRQQQIIAEEASQAGQNLVLAIDNGLQEAIVQALKRQLLRQAAAVVALDPNTGKIRGLISWPTFNHNAFSQSLAEEEYKKITIDPLKPLFNRAIAGEYPSGSTIKLIIAAAALKEKLINRPTQVISSGGVWYDQWFFPDWKEGGHGLTDIIKALAESVNTYFYYLALEEFAGHKGLGLEQMLNYFRLAGLGRTLGIDLAGEQPGFLPTAEWKEKTKGEIWYPGDTLHLAIGQGDLLVTPLQIASLTALVANGGTLYTPELVEEIINPQSGEVKQIESKIINSGIFRKDDLEIVAEGMRAAVLRGSASSLASLPIAVAGKTGTAQASGKQKPHAWFTSFAPYLKPELVLTIIVENGGEGSEVAVPLAREIWQWYYQNRFK